MTAITLTLSNNDAQLVRLALLYLIAERRKAPAHAAQLAEADRAGFINDAAADVAVLQRIATNIAVAPYAERDARAAVRTAAEGCEYHALHAANGGSSRLSAGAHRQRAAEHSRIAFETSTRFHAGQRA